MARFEVPSVRERLRLESLHRIERLLQQMDPEEKKRRARRRAREMMWDLRCE